jgi:hypothetical protein
MKQYFVSLIAIFVIANVVVFASMKNAIASESVVLEPSVTAVTATSTYHITGTSPWTQTFYPDGFYTIVIRNDGNYPLTYVIIDGVSKPAIPAGGTATYTGTASTLPVYVQGDGTHAKDAYLTIGY